MSILGLTISFFTFIDQITASIGPGKSCTQATGDHAPPISEEACAIHGWGAPRIHGELLSYTRVAA